MFDDKRGLDAAKAAYGPAAGRMIDRYGERIWDTMCTQDAPFTRATIIQQISDHDGIAYKSAQQYVGAFFAYCLACPDTFNGPKSLLERAPKTYEWVLRDGANMADYAEANEAG